MGKLELALLRWWKGFRPMGQNRFAHTKNPTINTVTKAEWNLAKEAAKLAKSLYNNDGTLKSKI